MPRETPSPIDLPDVPLEEPGLGWTAVVIGVAAVFLLAFNAVSLRDWADDLTPGPTQARVAAAAQGWLDATDAVGIGAPRAWLHARWKEIEGKRFGSDTTGPDPATQPSSRT